MTTVIWPSSLPALRSSGMEGELANTVKSFEVDDGGPSIQGIFSTVNVRKLTFTIRCDKTQKQTFLTFFNGDAARGASWFTFSDPITEQVSYARFIAKKPPKVVPAVRGVKWDISMTLELK